MPSGPVIDGFAEKLRLAMGRANLSRAQLAQAVAVDKTVVGRWLNGVLAPSDHSLTALTAVLARHLPQFDRVAWESPVAEFARRMGVERSPSPSADGDPALLPRALQSTTPFRAFAEQRFAALWILVFPAPGAHGRITFFPMRIGWLRGGPAMPIEYLYRPVAHQRGFAIDLGGWLYGVMEAQINGRLAFLMLEGVTDEKPLVLDGLLTAARAGAMTAMFCVRALAFRLGDLPDEAALRAVEDRAVECFRNRDGERLPEAMLAAFRMPVSAAAGPYWIVHEHADSWTTGDTRSSDPARAPQMQALAAVRALFADLLPPENP
jgi:transcriptional regulator with XRE-family HTH domain